jgi:hypothetical protein
LVKLEFGGGRALLKTSHDLDFAEVQVAVEKNAVNM